MKTLLTAMRTYVDDAQRVPHQYTDLTQAEDTAKSSGPTAAAAARKGNVVPKEDDLKEVDDLE